MKYEEFKTNLKKRNILTLKRWENMICIDGTSGGYINEQFARIHAASELFLLPPGQYGSTEKIKNIDYRYIGDIRLSDNFKETMQSITGLINENCHKHFPGVFFHSLIFNLVPIEINEEDVMIYLPFKERESCT